MKIVRGRSSISFNCFRLFRLFPQDEYYLALLYFTGSNVFNQNMRKIALENGYTLNEYSLRKIGTSGKFIYFDSSIYFDIQ